MKIPPPFDRGNATPAERAALFEALCVVLGTMHEAGMVGPAVRLTDAPPPEFGMGSVGPLVVAWQSVIGAKTDGKFGPVTLAKTKAWAKAAGFGERSTVTPAMWATAVGATVLFEGDTVILPDGSRLSLEQAAAAAKAGLGTP